MDSEKMMHVMQMVLVSLGLTKVLGERVTLEEDPRTIHFPSVMVSVDGRRVVSIIGPADYDIYEWTDSGDPVTHCPPVYDFYTALLKAVNVLTEFAMYKHIAPWYEENVGYYREVQE